VPQHIVQIAPDAVAFRHLGQVLNFFLCHLQFPVGTTFFSHVDIGNTHPNRHHETGDPEIRGHVEEPRFQPEDGQKGSQHGECKPRGAEHKSNEHGRINEKDQSAAIQGRKQHAQQHNSSQTQWLADHARHPAWSKIGCSKKKLRNASHP
jgi:hypothetical protein